MPGHSSSSGTSWLRGSRCWRSPPSVLSGLAARAATPGWAISQNKAERLLLTRQQGIVPFAVKRVSFQTKLLHLLIRHLDTLGITALIQYGFDVEPCLGRRACYQVHHGRQTIQRTPSPVLADVAKQPVFDLIPLTRTRREVADTDSHPQLIGQALQLDLP